MKSQFFGLLLALAVAMTSPALAAANETTDVSTPTPADTPAADQEALAVIDNISPQTASPAAVATVEAAVEQGALGDRRGEARAWLANATAGRDLSTPTPTPTPADTPAPDQEASAGRNVSIKIDKTADVVHYAWSNGQFEITIRAEIPKENVAISESIGRSTKSGDATSGTFAIRQYDLSPGKTTVSIPARKFNGVAMVTLTTRQCIAAGSCPYLQAGGGSPSPYERTGSTAGWLGGATVAMIMTGLAAYRIKNRNPSKPEEMQ